MRALNINGDVSAYHAHNGTINIGKIVAIWNCTFIPAPDIFKSVDGNTTLNNVMLRLPRHCREKIASSRNAPVGTQTQDTITICIALGSRDDM